MIFFEIVDECNLVYI